MTHGRGLTLLELMLALTIFSLVSLAVFMVFRTGLNVYEASNRELVVLQRARYVFDQFGQDVRAIYYLDESAYNEQLREDIANRFAEIESGYLSEFEEDEEENNPFNQGKLIDLQFFAEDGGEADQITFPVHVPYRRGMEYRPFGITRVSYSLEGDVLLRSEQVIEAPERDPEGYLITEPPEPDYMIVAQGVLEFDLSYSFWNDNMWYEVPVWASTGREYRNSFFRFAEDEEEDELENLEDERAQLQQNELYNGLPATIRMRLVLQDPENEARVTEYTRIFRVGTAEERYLFNQELSEDEREEEQRLREGEYTPILPGGLAE